MKRLIVGAVVAVMMTLGGSAVAAGKGKAKGKGTIGAKVSKGHKKGDSCAEQRKRNPKADCSLDIEGSDVDGNKVGPNIEDVHGVGNRPPPTSLIKVRGDFNDKIVKRGESVS
jgi:hypothetical protein